MKVTATNRDGEPIEVEVAEISDPPEEGPGPQIPPLLKVWVRADLMHWLEGKRICWAPWTTEPDLACQGKGEYCWLYVFGMEKGDWKECGGKICFGFEGESDKPLPNP